MAGTIEGGKQAAATNKSRHGENFYKLIGKEGGKSRAPQKGFGADRKRARIAGAKGGTISRRTWTPEQRKAQSLLMRKYLKV